MRLREARLVSLLLGVIKPEAGKIVPNYWKMTLLLCAFGELPSPNGYCVKAADF